MFDTDDIAEELEMLTNGGSSWSPQAELIRGLTEHADYDPDNPEGSMSDLINRHLRNTL